jgi:tetratricopeptide (TPR) repeat protein
VLQSLGSEGIESATAALLELEMEVARQHESGGLEELREVELAVAADLAQVEVSLLLPLIALHEASHLEYRLQILETNPYHARATVYRQAQLYSEELRTASERKIASDLFVSLAGYFHEGSTGPGVAGLYSQALQFDPDNAAALLGLATVREQSGRYRNALSLLERLVETGNASAEARLRLAMNLDRLGKRSEAERILESLLSEQTPDWVSSLAYQQLARSRMDQERFDAAHAYLADGLSRFPEDPGLAVGLDYVEERLSLGSGQPRIDGKPVRDAKVSSSSARYLYARPGYQHIEETRGRLYESAIQSLPNLARTLSTLSDGP